MRLIQRLIAWCKGGNQVALTGRWTMILRGPDGKLKAVRKGKNIVVTAGKNNLAAHLADVATAYPMKYLAIGTGGTAEDAGQTALVTENCTRVTGVQSDTDNKYKVTGTFAAANGTGAVVEYGLFNQAAVGGTMFCRDVESVFNKGASDSLEVICEITLG